MKQLDLRQKVEKRRKVGIQKEFQARYEKMKCKGVEKDKEFYIFTDIIRKIDGSRSKFEEAVRLSGNYILEKYEHSILAPKPHVVTQVERLHFQAKFPIENVVAITKKSEEEVLNEVKGYMRKEIAELFRLNTLLFCRVGDEGVSFDGEGDFTYIKFWNNEGQLPQGEGTMITEDRWKIVGEFDDGRISGEGCFTDEKMIVSRFWIYGRPLNWIRMKKFDAFGRITYDGRVIMSNGLFVPTQVEKFAIELLHQRTLIRQIWRMWCQIAENKTIGINIARKVFTLFRDFKKEEMCIQRLKIIESEILRKIIAKNTLLLNDFMRKWNRYAYNQRKIRKFNLIPTIVEVDNFAEWEESFSPKRERRPSI